MRKERALALLGRMQTLQGAAPQQMRARGGVRRCANDREAGVDSVEHGGVVAEAKRRRRAQHMGARQEVAVDAGADDVDAERLCLCEATARPSAPGEHELRLCAFVVGGLRGLVEQARELAIEGAVEVAGRGAPGQLTHSATAALEERDGGHARSTELRRRARRTIDDDAQLAPRRQRGVGGVVDGEGGMAGHQRFRVVALGQHLRGHGADGREHRPARRRRRPQRVRRELLCGAGDLSLRSLREVHEQPRGSRWRRGAR